MLGKVKVGDKLFLSQRTGNCMVDMVKHPYTVVEVSSSGIAVKVQACKLIFYGKRYYDTIADEIREDDEGIILTLYWSRKHKKYQVDPTHSGYPYFAFFGKWEHQPYLD